MKQRVRFVDEPPPIKGPQSPGAVWMERLALLVDRPGEWAEVYSGTPAAVNQAATALRERQYHIPPGGWEFTMRSFRRGHDAFQRDHYPVALLFARYLGLDADMGMSVSGAAFTAPDAVWNQYGERICPKCERRSLTLQTGTGRYPFLCDVCALEEAPDGVVHGREATYMKKNCRCSECRRARREAEQARRRRNVKPASDSR